MEFSRQEQWSMLPFPPAGDFSDPGIELTPLASPALAGEFLTTAPWQINWLFYEEALLFYQHWFDFFHVSQNCFIPRQWCSFVRNIQRPVKMARTSMRNCLGWSLANVAFNTCLHYKETWNDLPRWFFFSSMKDRTRDFGTIQHIMRLAKRDRRTQLGMRQGSSLTPPLKGIKLN